MSQHLNQGIPSEVRDVILRYLSERLHAAAVSTAGAVQEVRQQVPGCDLADDEIIEFLTGAATDAGFGVAFDGATLSSTS
jgi:hypothetical protein